MKILDLDSKSNLFFEELNKPDKAKRYVRVIGDFCLTYDNEAEKIKSVVTPIMLIYTDGRQYLIDSVSKPVKCASLKGGGVSVKK